MTFKSMIKNLLLLALMFATLPVMGATPTLVQSKFCPNSGAAGAGGWFGPPWTYTCPLAEPVQAGNTLVVGYAYDNTGTPTVSVSDDKSNVWVQDVTHLTSANNVTRIAHVVSATAGTRTVSLTLSSDNGYIGVYVQEYYGLATSSVTDGTAICHDASAATYTSGSITPTQTGDLFVEFGFNNGTGHTTSFTAGSGSDSNITWTLLGADYNDATVAQYGVYSSTSALNPTTRTGTSGPYTGCAVAFKSGSGGTAPTQVMRIVHTQDQQMPKSSENPFPIAFPSTGNMLAVSFVGGGDLITGITSTPSNTWSCTAGSGSLGITASSQICYACNANTSPTLTASIARSGNTADGTFILYDFTGAATSCFDNNSGSLTGNQTSVVPSLTTCTNCLTPSTSSGVVIANAGWNFCTSTGSGSPVDSFFDAATYSGNGVNGPQPVDQNNGWLHFYISSTGAITTAWAETCAGNNGSNPESYWAADVAHFKAASSTPPAPPSNLQATPQ
jgi:hypothetical protein